MTEHVALWISVMINIGFVAYWCSEWAVAMGMIAWIEWQTHRHNARLKAQP